jgi:iron complex outermembrane recepter protein
MFAHRGFSRLTGVLGLLFLVQAPCAAQESQPNLDEMSIEQLMQIKVISAGKKEQPLADTASAVYVITQEEIRRSGVTSVPEALRLAPGVQVARISGNAWAITMRGFNYRYADKLLVLVDGRTVYSPIFGGVFWELLDLVLEDIERIEVIRGPGGTMWGANAMNGVINIITRRAQDTQGGLVTAAAGSQGYGSGTIRYGASSRNGLAYRIYGRYSRLGNSPALDVPGPGAYDAWQLGRAGFRTDWERSQDSLTFSGDFFRGAEHESFPLPLLAPPYYTSIDYDFAPRGGNFVTRWERRLDAGSDFSLQAFYDRVDRPGPFVATSSQIFDLDFQHHRVAGHQDLVWGLGLRATQSHARETYVFALEPNRQTVFTVNGFLQDEIAVLPSRLWLTLGTKLERNEYTGFEVQPNFRLRWKPAPAHTLWAAVSRAITIPNDLQAIGRRLEATFPAPGGMVGGIVLRGNRDLKEQGLLAYEFGYRAQPTRKTAFDVAGFYNIYHDFITAWPSQPEVDPGGAPPQFIVPLYFRNTAATRTYGAEFSSSYAPTPFWKLSASYTWLVEGPYPLDDPWEAPFRPGDSPRNQFQIHSYFSLPQSLEFDSGLCYVSPLSMQSVPSYARLDTRVGWRPSQRLEFSLGIQNILQPRHAEFIGPSEWGQHAQVARSAYGKITWRF